VPGLRSHASGRVARTVTLSSTGVHRGVARRPRRRAPGVSLMTVKLVRSAAPPAPVRSSRWAWIAASMSPVGCLVALWMAFFVLGDESITWWGDLVVIALVTGPPLAGMVLGVRSERSGNGLGTHALAACAAWLGFLLTFWYPRELPVQRGEPRHAGAAGRGRGPLRRCCGRGVGGDQAEPQRRREVTAADSPLSGLGTVLGGCAQVAPGPEVQPCCVRWRPLRRVAVRPWWRSWCSTGQAQIVSRRLVVPVVAQGVT
jgi:hypothetical protein